jgi:hypothetical protein
MPNLGRKRQFPQILAVNSPIPRPAPLQPQLELASSPMPGLASPIQGSPQPMPVSNHSIEDAEISYIANHLNNNLKMLLYLVDADKLKHVQNILFSKSSRQTRKHHSNKFERIPRQAAPAPPFAPTFPFADFIPGAIAPAISVNYQKQKKQTQKQTQKQKHKYQPANSFPDKESSYLEEVIN